MSPEFTIIIPNLHSPNIDRTLDSLRMQQYDLARVNVIVVGQDKYNLVHNDDLVHFDRSETPLAPAVARNRGMQQAKGDIWAFLDADCVAAPDWLAGLARRYQDPDVAVVGGGVAFPRRNYWALCDNLSWFHEVLHTLTAGTRAYLPSLNLSLRREVVDEVGGMDETYPRPAGEDTEWTTRMRLAGYTLYFEPRAVVHHHHLRNSSRRILEHAFYFGYNSVKVDARYMDTLKTPPVLRHSASLAMLSPLLAAGAALRVWRAAPRYWYTLPVLYLSKLSWCAGAFKRLQDNKKKT